VGRLRHAVTYGNAPGMNNVAIWRDVGLMARLSHACVRKPGQVRFPGHSHPADTTKRETAAPTLPSVTHTETGTPGSACTHQDKEQRYSCSRPKDERGIAYETRVHGDGVPVVVAGVTACQGARESRAQGEVGTSDRTLDNWEVCVMQSTETVLGVLRDRGRRGPPCDELYRQLFTPRLYLLAYGRIYSNDGAMTPGATAETSPQAGGPEHARPPARSTRLYGWPTP